MQWLRLQNLSSLKRVQTASFSMSRTYFASCLRKVMTLLSTMEGTAQPPEPMRRRSIVAGVGDGEGPTIDPFARGEQVQALAQGVQRDLHVLDDGGVGLVLLSKVFWRVGRRGGVCFVM